MRKITFLTAAFAAAILVTSCDKPCNCEEDTFVETVSTGVPSSIIPLAAADSLYKNYGNSRVSLIELAENITEEGDTISKDDANYKKATRAVRIPYQQLKEYMAYIEKEADSAKIDIVELRVYFGKYKDTYPASNKKGRATVFLNPAAEFTLEDGTRDTVSYAIINGPNGAKRAEMVGRILNPKEGYMSVGDSTSIGSQSGDNNNLIPPPETDLNDFN